MVAATAFSGLKIEQQGQQQGHSEFHHTQSPGNRLAKLTVVAKAKNQN